MTIMKISAVERTLNCSKEVYCCVLYYKQCFMICAYVFTHVTVNIYHRVSTQIERIIIRDYEIHSVEKLIILLYYEKCNRFTKYRNRNETLRVILYSNHSLTYLFLSMSRICCPIKNKYSWFLIKWKSWGCWCLIKRCQCLVTSYVCTTTHSYPL